MEVLVNVTIDGQEVSVPAGTTVLNAAAKAGIEIPTFCYYAKLASIGACRMCLVEVERMRGFQTACTTVVQEGMVVRTNTPAVVKARKGSLEFLLTNHPLDCPVCDKGGECDLQDQVFAFGDTVSRFIEEKRRKQKALPLSSFVIKDEERCVLCRRCVRFLEEWAGDVELDFYERGSKTVVSTFPGRQLESPFSGNVIELCPVGALTSIPFRFAARSWELKQVPGICTLCGVGCNLTFDSKANRLLRVVGRENSAVNDEWLCDRGRFGHDYVGSRERLTSPMIRRDGRLEPASWEEAIAFVGRRILEIARTANPDVVAAVGSARASNETNYLLQKWARSVVGTNNVDFAGRPDDGVRPLSSADAPLRAGVVVLVGVDPLGDAPMVELFIRRAALTKGTRVIAIGPKRPTASRYGAWLKCHAGTEPAVLAGLLHLLARDSRVESGKRADLAQRTDAYKPGHIAEVSGADASTLKQAADWLAETGNPLVLYGDTESEPVLPMVRNLLAVLGGEAALLTPHPNAWGALLMGAAPDRYPGGASVEDAKARESIGKRWGVRLSPRPGATLEEMLANAREGTVQAMFVVESDLSSEVPEARTSLETLRFLVVQDHFLTPTAELADVVLPSAVPAESDGSFVNLALRLQRTRQAIYPPKGVRPGWEIITRLAKEMREDEHRKRGRDDWGYGSAADVWHEITRSVSLCRECSYETMGSDGWKIDWPAERPRVTDFTLELPLGQEGYPLALAVGRTLFHTGVPLGRSPSIAAKVPVGWLLMNPEDAEALGVKAGNVVLLSSARGALELQAQVNEDVARGTMWAPLGVSDTPLSEILEPTGTLTRVRVSKR